MFKSLRLILAFAVGVLALPLVGVALAGAAPPPGCVVSLSPTATETLFAIGAGHQVQAVDSDSDYPTKGLPKKRINALDPSVEGVLGICKQTASYPTTKPDLVVISYDANDIQQKLTSLGVKVVDQDALRRSRRVRTDRAAGCLDRAREISRRARRVPEEDHQRGHRVSTRAPEQEGHRVLRSWHESVLLAHERHVRGFVDEVAGTGEHRRR